MPDCLLLTICLFTIIQICPNYYCFRLPTSIVPKHYDLKIKTYLDEFYFTGRVKIKVKCMEETNTIILHSLKLNITFGNTKVSSYQNNQLEIVEQKLNTENDFFLIELVEPLAKDHDYVIYIKYRGKINDYVAGFYRSSYEITRNSTMETIWLAATRFEPTDARRAFPCFDEPAFKAKFKVTLGHRKHLTAISNMPVENTKHMKHNKDWIWTSFQETVKMSTYLLAFIISDFAFVPASNNMSIWTRKNALNQVYLAKEIGPKLLHFYEKHFDIAYPLPKQDMVALPDFDHGAMENWGLIIYREDNLLLDANDATTNDKFLVVKTIAHELAHQWFGNLVTMKWWTDLWLNEGFATYMESVVVQTLFPKFQAADYDTFYSISNVFSADSLNSSHPVSVTIKNPNSIIDYFDTISYNKGALIIRMMSLYLGDEVFNKGISNYLKKYSFSNAEQDDLWNVLTEEAHKYEILPKDLTVKTIMDTWTLQTGYPVVNIKRNYETGIAEITQERYFQDSKYFNDQQKKECWWIPLSYTTESERDFNNTLPRIWLECPKQCNYHLRISNSNDWVIFNIQASGLYRVNYDENNWKMLINFLKSKDFKSIHVLDRAILIDNIMEFARTERVSYEIAFDLISYVKHDDSFIPWLSTIDQLSTIASLMKTTSGYRYIEKYIAKLIRPIYLKLGELYVDSIKKDSVNAIIYQQLIAETACTYGVKECRDKAIELFKNYKDNTDELNPIPKGMLDIVYCESLKNGNIDNWNFLFNKYQTSNVANEKTIILSALGCTENTEILNKYLEMTLDKNNSTIKTQNIQYVYNSVARNKFGNKVIKTFFKTYLKEIYDMIHIKPFLHIIANILNSEEEYEELVDFIKANKKYFNKTSFDKVITDLRKPMDVKLHWYYVHYKSVEEILRKYNDNYYTL